VKYLPEGGFRHGDGVNQGKILDHMEILQLVLIKYVSFIYYKLYSSINLESTILATEAQIQKFIQHRPKYDIYGNLVVYLL
jgi:hypothetical protein